MVAAMSKTTHMPVIGIPLDREPNGEYSKFPYYILRENYYQSLIAKGAIVLALPYQLEQVDAIMEMLDGVVIAGGAFDVDPALYGDDEVHETVQMKQRRTAFESAIAKAAMEKDMPILGVCGGEQLMNVLQGGSLVQHIPDSVEDCLEHEQSEKFDVPTHPVQIVPGTLLHKIVGAEQMMVNTSHHQAVKEPGEHLQVNCHAPDGVIEGIEHVSHRFCLGVQWHPEYEVSPADTKILEAFLSAARSYGEGL